MKCFIFSFLTASLVLFSVNKASAQIKLEDIPFDLGEILGKTKLLKVQKGFSPVFMLGNYQVNKVGILGEKLKGIKILGDVFDTKSIEQVTKLYKTYKTGLVVYKVLAAAGTAVTVYSGVKAITDDKANIAKTLMPAVGSLATGVATKLLTKAASYKAVDIFNGVVKKRVIDILSIEPASSTLGVGIYVKL